MTSLPSSRNLRATCAGLYVTGKGKDGEPVYHASHYDITIEDLNEHLGS